VADFLETHNTECDNFAYNSPIFFCWLRLQITFSPYFKAVFKGGVVSGFNRPTEFLILM